LIRRGLNAQTKKKAIRYWVAFVLSDVRAGNGAWPKGCPQWNMPATAVLNWTSLHALKSQYEHNDEKPTTWIDEAH